MNFHNMEITQTVEIARPSWAEDKNRLLDLLCSDEEWEFEKDNN